MKRKGPADKAYERKQHGDGAGCDAKGRAFLAGTAWSGQRGGSTVSAGVKSTQNADIVGEFVQPHGHSVPTPWNKSSSEEHRKVGLAVESHSADGRVCLRRNQSTDGALEIMSFSVPQTRPVISRSTVDRNDRFVPRRSTIYEQPFYYAPRSFYDNGDATAACVWKQRRTRPWDAVDQSRHARQLAIHRPDISEDSQSSHPTPTSLGTANSSIIQSNYELLSGSTYPGLSESFNDAGETFSSSVNCWSDTQMMLGNWCNRNSSSDVFGSVYRCQQNSNCQQPAAHGMFHL